ncbi:condensation domain-containing protein [Streptosporangium sp. NPDC002721]|uniref:condensation domain-containing protein n=1 Tax=Streptosporangium sp. NPDC002721 TaxID=3366188 RepID=UPI0036B67C5E
MTVSQKNVLEWISPDLPGPADILSTMVRVPRGSTMDAVGTALGALIGRQEALRTLVRDGEQFVHASGTLVAEVVEAESAGAGQGWFPPGRAFDPAADLPIRARVMTRSGSPCLVVLHVSHVAADLSAMTILRAELAALLAGRPLPVAAYHPADQATYERTPAGRRRLEGSVRYWARQVAEKPLCALGLPTRFPGARGHHHVLLGSRPAAEALAHIVANTGARPAAVVMAAFAALLTNWTGDPECQLHCLCNNRFSPELRDYVGTVAQETIIPFTASSSFLRSVSQTNAAALAAYRYGRYDSVRLFEAKDSVERARGMRCHRDVVVNNTTGHARVILPRAGVEPGAGDRAFDAPAELDIYRLDGTLGCGLGLDARLATADETAALLGGVERLIVAAAAAAAADGGDGDVDPAGFGIPPAQRGPGWVRIRSCWVDLAGVQAAADLALGPGAARIEVAGDELVARVGHDTDVSAAAGAVVDTVLREGRHGVVAPSHYVRAADWERSAR